MLKEQIDNGNNPIKDFGVRHYEHVWEYIVNSIFGSNNIEKYYPTTNYVFNDESTYSPSKLRPDTIFVNNDNFYIFEQKNWFLYCVKPNNVVYWYCRYTQMGGILI